MVARNVVYFTESQLAFENETGFQFLLRSKTFICEREQRNKEICQRLVFSGNV